MNSDTDQAPTPMLAAVCQALGEEPREWYPLGELAALLRRAEFAADPDLLSHLAALNRVPRPGPDGFSALDADVVLCFFDSNRLWAAGSRRHAPRKTPARLERERLKAAGEDLPHAQHLTLNHLALLLAVAGDRSDREWLAELLLDRFEVLGIDPHA